MLACGLHGPLAQAELDALEAPFAFTANGNRSLVASMKRRKFEVWARFAHRSRPTFEVALRELETSFSRKDLGRWFFRAADLLQARLLPEARH